MIVVSGGQTGVDRAALDAAMALSLPVGGWCPQGRRAEDGVIDARYPLTETMTPYYVHRTRLNVRDTDASLVLVAGRCTGGTALTVDFAQRMHRPLHIVDVLQEAEPKASTLRWLGEVQPAHLNVAGPREGQVSGIYARARRYCMALFRPWATQDAIR